MALRRMLLCGLAVSVGLVLAQSPSPSAPQARRITLNVIARDSHGQPVSDLGGNDFQVTDQGKNEHITVSGPTAHTVPHTIVILFDLLNANLSHRGYGAEEIEHSLQKLESGDHVYLYLVTNTGGLYPVHGLPGPDADLRPTNADGPWTRRIKPLLDEALRAVSGIKPADETDPAVRVETTYRALDMLGLELAPLPGRKDVIWITHGVPIAVRLLDERIFDYSPQLQRLATRMDRAGIAIYSVDQGEAVDSGSKETIQQFSNVTGGKVYPSGYFENALTEVLEAPRASYVIEYAAPAADGKFHKVRVTMLRKGVHLQAEQGYLE